MGFLKPFLPLSSPAVFDKHLEDDLFDEFLMEKLIYIHQNSDLDVFQLGATEQINQIICALNVIFEHCTQFEIDSTELPEHIEHVLINLVHFSMSLWFSLEWQVCDWRQRCHLLQTLFRLESLFSKVSHLSSINWFYLKDLGLQPWSNPYFKSHLAKDSNMTDVVTNTSAAAVGLVRAEEDIREQANEDDIQNLRKEGLVITLLRLTKLFDAGALEAVKSFSIRTLSAWNLLQQRDGINKVHPEAQRCLNMISHIYMMAVYEKDNLTGYDIDNMINDVRIYHKTITDSEQNGKVVFDDEFHNIVKTPAALIALTSIKMKQSFQDMAETAIKDLVRETSTTRFGVVAHSYITYLLANILVEFNKQDVEDFDANIDTYKRLLQVYVREREKSERFALEESRKRKLLNTSCNITTNVKEIYNYKAAIGKGNRRSNLITEKSNSAYLFDVENEKRFDPVFQTMPYNKIITNEFYKLLSQSNFKGWHFARLVLLLKIIDTELKEYNNWCYHPGLSTDFMLTLESKLAQRFVDLARIFEQHIFMEQEFWLTAFYFRPDEHLYNKVTFCGARYQRMLNSLNRSCLNELIVKHADKTGTFTAEGAYQGDGENSCAFMNAKYGLLSSTYDVKQIASMTNKGSAQNDYADLSKALRALRLPENIIKDILTVTFSGRHANYTWAVDWGTLRKRCKALYQSPLLKRKLVESNMAEANDRLKYLKVDYEKYQNLPQLDYGTIEEGYEGAYTSEGRQDDEDDESDIDDVKTNDNDRNLKRKTVGRQTKNSTKDLLTSDSDREEECQNLPPPPSIIKEPEIIEQGSSHKRSSARRAAAAIAMLREEIQTKSPSKTKKEDSKKPVELEATTSTSRPATATTSKDQLSDSNLSEISSSSTMLIPAIPEKVPENSVENIVRNEFVNMPDYWLSSVGVGASTKSLLKLKDKFPKLCALKQTTALTETLASDINVTQQKAYDRNENQSEQLESVESTSAAAATNKKRPRSHINQKLQQTMSEVSADIPTQQSSTTAENQASYIGSTDHATTMKEASEKTLASKVVILDDVMVKLASAPLAEQITVSDRNTQTQSLQTTVFKATASSELPSSALMNILQQQPSMTPSYTTKISHTESSAATTANIQTPAEISTQTPPILTKVVNPLQTTTPAANSAMKTTPTDLDFTDFEDMINTSVVMIEPKQVSASVREQQSPLQTDQVLGTIEEPQKSASVNQKSSDVEYKSAGIDHTKEVPTTLTRTAQKPAEIYLEASKPILTKTAKLSIEQKITTEEETNETSTTIAMASVADNARLYAATPSSSSGTQDSTLQSCLDKVKTETTEPEATGSETEQQQKPQTPGNQQLTEDDDYNSTTTSSSGTERQSKLEDRKKLLQEMIKQNFKRKCYVKIKRICMKGYELQKRLPTVRLKRMNMEKYFEESSRSRSASKSKSIDSEEHSPSPAPVINMATARRSCPKRRPPSSTPEESASHSSDDEYLPSKTKKRSIEQLSTVSRASSTSTVASSSSSSSKSHKNKSAKPTGSSGSLLRSIQQRGRRNADRNFSVVPRSASGMKVCISSSSLRDVTPPAECIEILSSDEDFKSAGVGGINDEQDPLPTCPIQFANVSMPLADFTDFEMEEI